MTTEQDRIDEDNYWTAYDAARRENTEAAWHRVRAALLVLMANKNSVPPRRFQLEPAS
jgi:hypothetical protein